MITEKTLVETIIEAIQEKKGKKIAVLDLHAVEGRSANYYIVCEGNTPVQVGAIADSIKEFTRDRLNEKYITAHGYDNSIWIVLDFGAVMVHVFQKDYRGYYDIDHLWNNVPIENVPDLD